MSESLSDKKRRYYTGDTIEGCAEWYYHYEGLHVKNFIKNIEEDFGIELNKIIKHDGNVGVSDVRTIFQTILIKRAGKDLI